jgi:hypothetical protein
VTRPADELGEHALDAAAEIDPRVVEDDAHGSADPLVSVVLPVRNGERHLDAALASLHAQTWSNWELVAIDDGSTDATPELLARAAADDERVRVFRQDARGLVAALQRGTAEARGPYLARMDADDESTPTRLAHQVAHLEANPAVVLVGGSFDVVDDAGARLRTEPALVAHDDLRRELYVRNAFAHGSVMLRRSALDLAAGYRDDRPAAEDYDLWRRLAGLGELTNLPEVVYRWRTNPAGVTQTRAAEQAASASAVRDDLWAAGTPGLLDRHELRQRVDVYARVPGVGPDLADRFRQVQLALVVELARRGRRRAAWEQLVAYGTHHASAPVTILVFLASGRRFTSGRRLLEAARRRARARSRR